MPYRLNLSGNAKFAPAGGYPFRLWPGGQLVAEGVVPRSAASVTAVVYSQSGTADVHLAIYEAPTSITSNVLSSDGALVVDLDDDDATIVVKSYRADALAVGLTETTLSVAMPTNRAAQTYVARLWADNITGRVIDSVDRDVDGLTSDETLLPTGVYVTSMDVA